MILFILIMPFHIIIFFRPLFFAHFIQRLLGLRFHSIRIGHLNYD